MLDHVCALPFARNLKNTVVAVQFVCVNDHVISVMCLNCILWLEFVLFQVHGDYVDCY